MFPKMKQYGIDKLSDEEKRELADEIWESLDEFNEVMPPLTAAQRLELERRIADLDANPNQKLYSWEEVKAHIRAK